MVTLVLGWQRMRKQSGKTTVPLDAVAERRTERCSPRFRPGGRFWGEPRFRYLSPGREGEICRPLDHRWQILSSTQLDSYVVVTSIYIEQCSSYFLHVVASSVPWYSAILRWRMHSCRITHLKVQNQYLSHAEFHTVRGAGAYWHIIDVIYTCTFQCVWASTIAVKHWRIYLGECRFFHEFKSKFIYHFWLWKKKTDPHGINTPLLFRGQKKLFENKPIFPFCANSF